jgi:hypothetical protein
MARVKHRMHSGQINTSQIPINAPIALPMRDHRVILTTTKPFHLMTPAERTTARIAQNRASSEKIALEQIAHGNLPQKKSQRTVAPPSVGGTRATPEDRAKMGSLIRKVKI